MQETAPEAADHACDRHVSIAAMTISRLLGFRVLLRISLLS
jgi:hypothetical protein